MSHYESLLAKLRVVPPLASPASSSKQTTAKKDMFGSFKGLVSSFDSKLGSSPTASAGSSAARRPSISGGGPSSAACIAVIGLGYVGLPLSIIFHDAGYNVVAFDVDAHKIASFSSATCYLPHLQSEWEKVCSSKSPRYKATCSEADVGSCDVFIVCVPTPLGPNQDPDLSHVTSATELVSRHLRPGCLFVLESTSFPGTTEEVCLPILRRCGLSVGGDFFLAYSSEREDPGNAVHSMRSIPKVVGGYDEHSLALADAMYSTGFSSIHKVSSCRVAEASKIVENVYRCVNIALVNELKMIFDKMDIDIWEVLDASATKPFGFHRFNPGPGWGGHCIPVDPFYLAHRARAVGMEAHFIQRAGEINAHMPAYVVSKVVLALNDRCKAVNGSRILIVGLAYKANMADCRETPAFHIWTLLEQMGAHIVYHDPFVPEIKGETRAHAKLNGMRSVSMKEGLASADVAVVVTHHSCLDWNELQGFGGVVVDTRNCVTESFGVPVYKA